MAQLWGLQPNLNFNSWERSREKNFLPLNKLIKSHMCFRDHYESKVVDSQMGLNDEIIPIKHVSKLRT